jgi:hypothetical protein
LSIEYDNVDLFAEHAVTVNDEGPLGLVALREVLLEEFKPDLLAGVSLGHVVHHGAPADLQAFLQVLVQAVQQIRQ